MRVGLRGGRLLINAACQITTVGMAGQDIEGRLVRYVASDGAVLHGMLVAPSGAKTCIIHVHGMTGNFYESGLGIALAKEAAARGIATFLANTRGHDPVALVDLQPSRGKGFILAGTDYERFEDCVLDIRAAMAAMHKYGFRRFVLSGHSTGCQKVAYYQHRKKDAGVVAVLLFAPADDYNIHRKELGRRFGAIVALCRRMVKGRRGKMTASGIPSSFCARRFLSVADLACPEARLFNYDGSMKEFASIRVPIFAAFGSEERHALKPVATYLDILRVKSGSRAFHSGVVGGAGHSFEGHEGQAAGAALDWLGKGAAVNGLGGRGAN